ncbi:tyrosine-type recombinase/integrase [Thiolinea disciformis]|uniref:tyrosine-type recombinase/integrase n=1 Tax=Thiolinea disciformis TaxID=125614 RepID=UPI00036ED608|nr:tyrosine-type recombinase/integrase [Thiolinea disciformis]
MIDEFLTWFEHSKGRQPNTIQSYESSLRELASFLSEKNKVLLAANRYDLEAFTGINAHNAGLSVVSRRPLVAAVRAFYTWAHKHEHLGTNPAQHLSYPKAGKSLPVPITTNSLEKLLTSIKLDSFINVRDAAMIALLAGTGMRISGLLSLNQSSLLGYERFRDVNRVTIRVTEKGKKQRIVPVPDVAVLYLHAYLGQSYLDEVDRRLPNGDKVLFINTTNTYVEKHEHFGEALRLTRRSVLRMIKKRGGALGITPDQLRPHALRHWLGTDLLNRGRNLKEIQMILGHADIRTTEIYLHLAMDRLIEASDSTSLNIMDTPMKPIADKMKRAAHKIK